MKVRLAAALVCLLAAGCAEEESDPQAALAARGQQVYQANCTACHALDPTQPGPVGPDLAGSSLALLQAKVLKNEYPPGHRPKRDTQAMVPLVHLAPELPALAAYLAQAGGKAQE